MNTAKYGVGGDFGFRPATEQEQDRLCKECYTVSMIRYTITREFPLRKKMDKANLTIRGLAKRSGVHYTYISRLLTGKSIASEAILEKLKSSL